MRLGSIAPMASVRGHNSSAAELRGPRLLQWEKAEQLALDEPLDHAEHDGADEGHGEVGGDNAQFTGERHEVAPACRALCRNRYG